MARVAAFASLSVGATAFTQTGTASPGVLSGPAQSLGQQATINRAADAKFGDHSTGAAFGAAAALSLVAAASHSRRAARIARKSVVTYNSEGQARFVTDGAASGGGGGGGGGGWSPQKELGVQAPTGFWDPLGYCDNVTELEFKRLRSCELKHGRISMIACSGFLVTAAGIRLPGYLSPSKGLKFADMPAGLAAISKVPTGGWIQIFLFATLCEFGNGVGIEEWKTRPGGDYDMGAFGLFGPITDPVKKERGLNSELANGRLAMVAIIGMIAQCGALGTTNEPMWVPGG